MPAPIDTQKVQERKIEYVMTLRTVLREVSSINREPENLEAAEQIERALNGALMVSGVQGELVLGGKAA